MKLDKDWLIIGILFCVIAFLSWKVYFLNNQYDDTIEQIHIHDNNKNKYNIIYYDQTIASLKQSNKSLYDSLKMYQKEIDYLIKFKTEKHYIIDTIFIDTIKRHDINTYEYCDTTNDTLQYKLKIGSKISPSWYSLDMKIANEFTIINKEYNDQNHMTISSSNNSTISDVTVFKKKKNKILDNISIGPSVNVGYDVLHNNFGINVGLGISYRIDLTNIKK